MSAVTRSFYIAVPLLIHVDQILKPAEKKQKYVYGSKSSGGPSTPSRKSKN